MYTIRQRVKDRRIILIDSDVQRTGRMFAYALTGKDDMILANVSVNLNIFTEYIVKGYDSYDGDDSRTMMFIKAVYSTLILWNNSESNTRKRLPGGKDEIQDSGGMIYILGKYCGKSGLILKISPEGWMSFAKVISGYQ